MVHLTLDYSIRLSSVMLTFPSFSVHASQSPFDTGYKNVITPQNKRISAMLGDAIFQAPRRQFLRVARHTQPVWSYSSRVLQGLPILGTFHASDVLNVFGLIPSVPTNEIQSRYISFANSLNPNVDGYAHWPNVRSLFTFPPLSLSFLDLAKTVVLLLMITCFPLVHSMETMQTKERRRCSNSELGDLRSFLILIDKLGSRTGPPSAITLPSNLDLIKVDPDSIEIG